MKKLFSILFLLSIVYLILLPDSSCLLAQEQSPATIKEAEKTNPLPFTPTQKTKFSSVEERRLYQTLQQERETLHEEKKLLVIKEKELKTLKVEVDKKLEQVNLKIKEVQKIKNEIEALLIQKDQKELKRIKELSKIYEKMTPNKAAITISSLDLQLAADLLANMKVKSAARILDKLDKGTASRLSKTFAISPSE